MNHSSRLQRIVEEHATIRATVVRIELELDRLRTHPTQPEEPWALPGLVRSFRGELKRHFELEESGGLLGDAAAYFEPATQLKVTDLIGEHRRFEHAIDRICDEIDDRFVPDATVQECLDGELRTLLEALARHESVENSLLRQLLDSAGD